jgi:hypothetical protein
MYIYGVEFEGLCYKQEQAVPKSDEANKIYQFT